MFVPSSVLATPCMIMLHNQMYFAFARMSCYIGSDVTLSLYTS